ncbi:MAG: hypothetical protein KJ666_05215 [Bacteroidetes bacterium]|nr:hypothetical protein [Bacteroidota bacterium]MBU2584801.1 hypothetical protein [Bacteroidota bacterium]
MLEKSIKTVLNSDIPHQKCLKHMIENVKRILNYSSTKAQYNKLMRMHPFGKKHVENRIVISQEKAEQLEAIEDKYFV